MHPRFRERLNEVFALRVEEFEEHRAQALDEIFRLIRSCERLQAVSPSDVYRTATARLDELADSMLSLDPTDAGTPDTTRRIADEVCMIAGQVLQQYRASVLAA